MRSISPRWFLFNGGAAFLLLPLPPMAYGFATILRAPTATATAMTKTAITTRTTIETTTTTMRLSLTWSDEDRNDAEETTKDAVARALADLQHRSAAIKKLTQELKNGKRVIQVIWKMKV